MSVKTDNLKPTQDFLEVSMDFFFNLIYLIPLYPLLAFALIVLGLNRYKKASAWTAVGAIGLSTIHAWLIVVTTIADMARGEQGIHIAGWNFSFDWIPLASAYFPTGFAVDGLTATRSLSPFCSCF